MAKEKAKEKTEVTSSVETRIGTRGRTFEGTVTKKFHKRIVIEFERTVYVVKYERFYRKKTRLHARLPDSMIHEINIGDYVRIRECRPLSKIIHFMVVKKLKSLNENAEASKLIKKEAEIEQNKKKIKEDKK